MARIFAALSNSVNRISRLATALHYYLRRVCIEEHLAPRYKPIQNTKKTAVVSYFIIRFILYLDLYWIHYEIYFFCRFRFRILFVHWIPCISLVILNFLLFRAMRDAEKKRARLLNSNRKVNVIKGESKESKKIRDANTTTLMLIVVISVRRNIFTSFVKSRLKNIFVIYSLRFSCAWRFHWVPLWYCMYYPRLSARIF